MRYRNGIGRGAAALALVSAATLLAAACQPAGEETVSATPSVTGKPSGAPGPAASEGGGTSVPPADPAGGSSSGGSGGSDAGSGGAAPTCADKDLKGETQQASTYPPGTGTGAVVVGFTNTSGRPCTVQGFPTVAAAGMTRPDMNRPLAVTRTGSASTVRLAPGGKAWVKLTFVQVQGEADGYCESGAEPASYPSLIVGLPGSGKHQVQMDDARAIVMCDDKATVTSVSESKPS
ncbi:DUF4232 domain-containing protein [Streptomyces sp. NPDC016309]|uniref:DUF4232 domain-containing protein n=1 Tax=Streptomyces sp. NPDC016309 TaxID=3364965 RepID=UPI00370130D6